MRITGFVEVSNRLCPAFNMRSKNKGAQCQVSVGRKPGNGILADEEVWVMISNKQDRNGAKYKIKGNIEKVFTKFIHEGKATVRFLEPPHDVCISKADPVQLKGLLTVVRMALQGENLEKVKLSSLAPVSAKTVEKLKTKLSIRSKREYPITTGFPPQIEHLIVVTCNLKKIDGRILALRHLTRLDMSDNVIRELPTDFERLDCLSELILHNNQIEEIPKVFCTGKLTTTLNYLDLSNNKLRIIRPYFGKLRNLVTLKLQGNQLCALSSSMRNLTQLRTLHVNNNQLRTLPAGFADLRLDVLDLSDNLFLVDGPASAKVTLHFPTLLETAARAIKKLKIPYTEEDVGHLLPYLDSAKQCLCGNHCMQSFVHYLSRLDLRRVATNLTAIDLSGRMHAPAEAFLCSQSCLERYRKNPYATMWRG